MSKRFPENLMPRSLASQMAILIGVALLVAQLANMALLLNEGEKRRLAQDESLAIAAFVSVAADYAADGDLPRGRGRRFAISPQSPVVEKSRVAGLEARVGAALSEAGVVVRAVHATRRDGPPPWLGRQGDRDRGDRGGDRRGDRGDRPPWEGRPGMEGQPGLDRAAALRNTRQVVLAAQLPDGRWLEGRLPSPKRDPVLTYRLIAATVFLYLIVLGVTVAIAGWLARPLRALTASAEGFGAAQGGQGERADVTPRGPGDVRRLIVAFNAMTGRVRAMINEKDRMLGAIGHDLRTPLASLRIRAENLDPGEDRDRMIATIGEATAMLEDILVLARTGRVREEARDVDLAALLDAVAEEYVELGRPVTLIPSPRTVGHVQPALLRRAIRNLVDNAVAYGAAARLSVTRIEGEIRITVSDDGPGIPDADLARLVQPFERGETSRNRETGGSGLGLAIADAVIQGHGGHLTLANREGGGLDAALHLPG